MCKNAEEDFCKCDFDDELSEKQMETIQQVIQEMFDKNNVDSGTKTTEIIREVQTVKTGETQVIKEEANPLIFVLVGVGITLVAVAVALATAYCVLKKRRQNEKIVVFDETG